MLIDEWLPGPDIQSRTEILVEAPPGRVYAAVREVDFSDSFFTRLLFRLRGMGAPALSLRGLEAIGFVPLQEEEGEEFVLGLVGRFWQMDGGLLTVEPAEFRDWWAPGYAKGALNFAVYEEGQFTRLVSETRVKCTDAWALRRFRLYWAVIRPFSGQIRREILRSARDAATLTDAV